MPRRRSPASASPRATARLSRDAIVDAAIGVADRDGIDALSMRRLGQELSVNPMSLYYHVHDKDDLLEAMVDALVAQIDPDGADASTDDWTGQLRALIQAARRTMLAHPWAPQVIESRDAPSPATLAHIERLLAILRGGGCSVDLSHHALHLLGSRILGFSQDLFTVSAEQSGNATADPAPRFESWAEAFPHVVELAAAATHDGVLSGCDDEEVFAFAFDVLLEGLERRRQAAVLTSAR
jgi:AcrR family transcriptional regulator